MSVVKKCLLLSSIIATFSVAETIKSTDAQRTSLEVTVYNSDLGLIKETRKIPIQSGSGEMQFMDVAAMIKPVTVHVKALSSADFTVLEQNFEFDLINPEKLMEKYVGKKIKLVEWNQFKDRKETVEATLLSTNGGEIYQVNNEIYIGYPGYKVLPELPENLIARPTLTWQFTSKSARDQNIEVSYLSNGLSWNADYILVLGANEKKGDLSGWVSVTNQCGIGFKDASLKLVAGNVNQEQPQRDALTFGMAKSSAAPREQFEEQKMFEYHMYDLQRKTTLKQNQTKQISLLEANGVKVNKEYLTRGTGGYYTSVYQPGENKQPVNVFCSFSNSKDNDLGKPIPAGIVRVYMQDKSNKQQFIGEDRIEHTPANETIRLKTGEAFDVVAERKQTDFVQKTTQLYESEWEITLRNHKDEDITIAVVEPLFGNWKINSSNFSWKKLDAFNVRFDVPVGKGKEVVVKYRVSVGLE